MISMVTIPIPLQDNARTLEGTGILNLIGYDDEIILKKTG